MPLFRGAVLAAAIEAGRSARILHQMTQPADHPVNIFHPEGEYLKRTEESYDLIVLDPPAYAKHTHARHNALQGYKRLNMEAIKRIRPGGILFTFSCSQVVDMPLFRGAVLAAAIEAGRSARILHQMSQPADHPVNIFHPEGEYLKGLVLLVG
jgi:23S rRNA (cytosine1962-C5)-methyltransferase